MNQKQKSYVTLKLVNSKFLKNIVTPSFETNFDIRNTFTWDGNKNHNKKTTITPLINDKNDFNFFLFDALMFNSWYFVTPKIARFSKFSLSWRILKVEFLQFVIFSITSIKDNSKNNKKFTYSSNEFSHLPKWSFLGYEGVNVFVIIWKNSFLEWLSCNYIKKYCITCVIGEAY